MQAAQITLKQYGHSRRSDGPKGLTAQLSNWLTRVFGCWHTDMSRPFTHNGESYRTCLDCGARRQFDSARWEMIGAYYYDAPQSNLTSLTMTASLMLKPRVRVSLQSGVRLKA